MKTKEAVCKRIILSIFFLLVLCRTAGAQDAKKRILSAADAGTCTSDSTACSFLTVPSGSGGVTFTITTNASANTIQFEATGDTEPTGSHTWVALNVVPSNGTTAVTSTTSTGTWQANIAGFTQIRLRCSTFVGGTTTTYINLSTASARSNGGGGSVTHTAGNLTAFHLMLGNGLADSTVDSACVTNGTGALSGCTSISAGSGASAAGATATGGFACVEAASTGWTPTAGQDYIRCDTTYGPVSSINGSAEGPVSLCTDRPEPGAWAPTWTAGHTYCLIAGTYTVAAAQAMSVANATVLCLTPAAIIQRTGTTDLFDVSGNNFTLQGCTLDGNSQSAAGTGPLVKVTAGTGTVITSNYIQNAGTTSATSAILYMTGGSNAKFLKNVFLGTTADPCIYINNSTAATTISDVLVDGNFVATFNPGASAFTCFDQRFLLGGTLAHTARITWSNNTIYARGASANVIALHGDILATGRSASNSNSWINNKVVLLAGVGDVYHWFGNYYNSFIGNIADTAGFTVSALYSLGDTYYSTLKGNIARNSGFANNCFKSLDGGRSVYDGNICDGIPSSGQGFYWGSTSGIMSDNIIANNEAQANTYFANGTAICFELEAATVSFTNVDNQFIGNHCTGSGGATQIGFKILDTAGTLSDTFLVGNFIDNVATGFNVGTGSANIHISETHFDTVTTQYTDSGTGTIIVRNPPPAIAPITIGSGTSIGSTSICSTTDCPVGTYGVNVYLDITTACGTTGTYLVSLIYTDDQGSKTIPVNINGTGAVPATGVLTTTSTANFGEASQIIRSTGAATINYSTTATACGTAGPMVGKLYLSLDPKQ